MLFRNVRWVECIFIEDKEINNQMTKNQMDYDLNESLTFMNGFVKNRIFDLKIV